MGLKENIGVTTQTVIALGVVYSILADSKFKIGIGILIIALALFGVYELFFGR